MLTIPRAAVRAFRSVLRKCITGRSRGSAPPVLLQAENNQIVFMAATVDVTVRWIVSNAEGQDSFVVPISALETMEGSADTVEIVSKSKRTAMARWSNRGLPQELAIDLLPPKQGPASWAMPEVWGESTEELLTALHEAGKSTAREGVRFALQRIQVQGTKGQILATDSHQALIQGGFAFPFAEIVHIPAIPVFGAKELAGQPVRIGRTETHLVVEAGPWTIWLTIDATARYPEVEAAVPKAKGATVVTLSETDVAFLLDLLPQFPGHAEESAPITLDVEGDRIAVRAHGSNDEKPGEVFLTGSKSTGPAMRIAFDRRFLLRALDLGCRRLRFVDPSRPFVALAVNRLYLAAVLDPSLCVGPHDTIPAKALVPSPVPPEITVPKSNAEPEPANPDLLAEAEGLRLAIIELAQRAGRLIAMLKSRKKDERVLNQVWSSLKSLQLGGGPPR